MKEYIEREAAVEEIRFVRSLVKTESEWLHGYASGLEAAVDSLVDAPTIEAEPVKPWISVNDTLPEEHTAVLMYFSCTNMAVGYMEKYGEGSINWCAYSDDGYYDDCNRAPIYWRELPNGPNCGAKMDLEVDNAPTIETEPVKHGRWIPIQYDGYADGYPVCDLWECSECQDEHSGDEDTLTPYCPNCGVKMDLEEKKDDV